MCHPVRFLSTLVLVSEKEMLKYGSGVALLDECLPLESLKIYGLLQLIFLPVLVGAKISFQ